MNVLWLSWKDREHPLAGGAETVSGEIMDRLARDGHAVRHITARNPGAEARSTVKGVEIYRTGNRYTVYWNTYKLFRTMKDWPDIVIDEMNTIPFAAGLYSKRKTVLLAYQLAREIWFYQMPFPVSVLGYCLEPLYLRGLSKKYEQIITESDSTVADLRRHGFNRVPINTFRIGTAIPPLIKLSEYKDDKTVLFLGAFRKMKRPIDAIMAFELARDNNPTLRMVVAGNDTGAYARKVYDYARRSRHGDAIQVLGKVTSERRLELLRQSTVILVTSLKEGWGLIVTEANTQGTPAIAYDTDGLRDSVIDNDTGLLVKSGDFKAVALALASLMNDDGRLERLRRAAWQNSKQYTFENSYRDFCRAVIDQ